MKTTTLLSLSIGIAMICQTHIGWASEVDDILKEINGDSKKSSSSESSSPSANTSLKKKSQSAESDSSNSSADSPPPPKPKTKKAKTASASSAPSSSNEAEGTQLLIPQIAPQSLTLFQPDEKIPNNVQGAVGFYGDFKIDMISTQGELWLQSAAAKSPFSRKFMISNNDLPRGQVINPSRELTIRISKKDPLVVTSRGLGFYQVNVSGNTWGILMHAVHACFQ